MGSVIIIPHTDIRPTTYTGSYIANNGVLITAYSDVDTTSYGYNGEENMSDIGVASFGEYGRKFVYAARLVHDNRFVFRLAWGSHNSWDYTFWNTNAYYDADTNLYYATNQNDRYTTILPDPFSTLSESLIAIDNMLEKSGKQTVQIPVRWNGGGDSRNFLRNSGYLNTSPSEIGRR